MLGLGNWVDNGKILGFKSPSFHLFSLLIAFSFHSFSSLYLLILLNLGLVHLFEFFLRNFEFYLHFIQAISLVLQLFCFCFSKVENSAMFCLLRLSITLRELWASNSHTSWY